jgi:hypothetical protein
MHFFDEVQIPQFSTSIPVRTWSFAGYKEFALHYWFRGQPGSKVYMEIYFNQLSGRREEIVITPGGISIAAKVYPVFAPNVGVVLYYPSAPMEGRIRVYAACCPDSASPLTRAIPFLQSRPQARVISDEVRGFDPQSMDRYQAP